MNSGLEFYKNGRLIDYIEEARLLLNHHVQESFCVAMEKMLWVRDYQAPEDMEYENVNLFKVVS